LNIILPNIELKTIASIFSISSFIDNEYLIMLTKKGIIKKTPLVALKHINSRGLVVLKIGNNDKLGWVRTCSQLDDIIISTKKGKALRFSSDNFQLKPTGRNSIGKNAMYIDIDDMIVDIDVLPINSSSEIFMLTITGLGYGKRIPCCEFKRQTRGGKGVLALKLKNSTKDYLVSMRCCKSDQEVLLITVKGTIVRQKIDAITVQSRLAKGVIVQKLTQEDRVSKVLILTESFSKIN